VTLPADNLFDKVRDCDLRTILEGEGFTFRADGTFQENPLREERTVSIRINGKNRSKWHDFGTDEDGDLIDFLQKWKYPNLEEARHEAARLLGVEYHGSSRLDQISFSNGKTASSSTRESSAPKTAAEPAEELKPPTYFDQVVDAAHEALLFGTSPEAKRARAYLEERGLGLDTEGFSAARTARLGVIDQTVDLPKSMKRYIFQGRLLLPYFDRSGRAVFLNARAAGNVAKEDAFRKVAGTTQTTPFGLPSTPERDHVILVEGELDALSILQALGPDTPVLASGGGGFQEEHLKALAKRYQLVFLCFDNDDQGPGFAKAARKTLEAAGGTVETLALPGDVKDANDALRASRSDLAEALRRQIEKALDQSDAEYLETTFLEEIERRHNRPFAAYPTGLANVDALLDGGYHEGLHILGGITGGGKTSFALRLALSNALEGRHVLYATYEQSKHEMWSRLAAGMTALPYGALKRGTYDYYGEPHNAAEVLQEDKGWERLKEAAKYIRVLEAGDALSRRAGEASLEALQKRAEALKRETGVPPLVIVDYLQRVPVPELQGREIRERVAHVAGMLQVAIAREVGSPVLALSSLNRDSYNRQGGKASLEARLGFLKEAGELEYTAYTVAYLSRVPEGEEPYDLVRGPLDKWRPVLFDLVKNREGETAETFLRWTARGDRWEGHEKSEPRR